MGIYVDHREFPSPPDEVDYKNGFWLTKEKKLFHVSKLETDHIKNIIKLLFRRAKEWHDEALNSAWVASSMLQGEHALDAVDSVIMHLEDADPYERAYKHPFFKPAMFELNKRGWNFNFFTHKFYELE